MSAMEIWTIKKLLEWVTGYFDEKGVDAPRLSAELLLCHVVGLERIQLYTLYDRVVDGQPLAQLRALVKRASNGPASMNRSLTWSAGASFIHFR
jgi:release factor glutamine methyltransferase